MENPISLVGFFKKGMADSCQPCLLRLVGKIAHWRLAQMLFEATDHIALVGEAAASCDLGLPLSARERRNGVFETIVRHVLI
jgi:hypothetical protein